MARRCARRSDAGDHAAVLLFLKNLAFTLIVPATVAAYLPWLIVHERLLLTPWRIALAGTLFAIGASIYLRCVWDFARFGRGTPAPIDAPKRLVVRGLYRYTRNPMYVGVLTVIAAWFILAQAPVLLVYGAGFGVAAHLFVVLYEEPHLRKIFGVEYQQYCSTVGRWLA